MNITELVDLSGIKDDDNFKEFDTAVPLDQATNEYPHGGRAISVYYKTRYISEIVSYDQLRTLAIKRIREILIGFKGIKLLKENKIGYYKLVKTYFELAE